MLQLLLICGCMYSNCKFSKYVLCRSYAKQVSKISGVEKNFRLVYSSSKLITDMRSTASSLSCSQVEGSELKKIRPSTRIYQRYYLLDAGLQALYWEPSKKESDKARIFLDSIREVSVNKKKKNKFKTTH